MAPVQPKPSAKPAGKSAAPPAAKPAASPAAKPAASPAAKSATSPAAKPATSPAAKPAASPAAKPAASPAAKPAAPSAAKPAAPSAAKPAAPPADRVKKAKVGKPRNYDLGNGIVRFSKTRMFHKTAKYKFIGKKNPKAPKVKKPTVVVKQIGGEKNGGTRTVLLKRRRAFYPTQDKIATRPHHKTFSKHVRNIRPNLVPGTVCILLAGRHAGKRVVLVGVLRSGLLLFTGPFAFNSCPLRRIPQHYVIGTSTRVDLGDFILPAHLDDTYFKLNKKSVKRSVKRKEGEDIFAVKKEKYAPSEQRKKDQKLVDEAVINAIGKRPDKKLLRGYLRSVFGLRSSQYPHRMHF